MKLILAVLIPTLFLSLSTKGQSPLNDTIPENPLNKPLISGYVRGVFHGGGSDYDYTNLFGEAALKAQWRRSNLQMNAELRVREGLFFDERKTALDLREAWAGYTSQHLDIYLGNQIVKWGRTDGFNPTDNITPVDYFLLTEEPDDQRLSNFMLQTRFRPFRNTSLTLIVIPVYKPSVYRFDLFDMGGGYARFLPAVHPDVSFSNSSLAAKFDAAMRGFDFSVSYFNGYSTNYGFAVDSISIFPNISIDYRPSFYKKQAIGFDLALPFAGNIFRGEAAFNIPEDSKSSMHIPNRDISYVAGIERSIRGTTLILQYIGKYTIDHTPLSEPVILNPMDPMELLQYAMDMIYYNSEQFNRQVFYQQEKTNHAVSLSLVRSFFYETLSAEATGYYNITSEEYMARVALHWSVNDNLKLSAGGIGMWGPDETTFDYAGKVMNGIFCTLKVHF